jgi:hypothetical protein
VQLANKTALREKERAAAAEVMQVKAEKAAKKRAADRERMQKRRHDETLRAREVRCNLCANTQSVCGIRYACLLFQNAARRERRANPVVRESWSACSNKTQSVHVLFHFD